MVVALLLHRVTCMHHTNPTRSPLCFDTAGERFQYTIQYNPCDIKMS